MNIEVSALEHNRLLRITYVDPHLKEYGPFELLLHKTTKMPELMVKFVEKLKSETALATETNGVTSPNGTAPMDVDTENTAPPKSPEAKVERYPDPARMRLIETKDNKITRLFSEDDWLQGIAGENPTLYIEERPLEEDNMGTEDKVINVFHFLRDVSKSHSTPFRFVLKHNEPFADTKKRLAMRMPVSEKEFARIKWSFVESALHGFPKPRPVDDVDVLASIYTGSTQDQLGAEHQGKTSSYRSFEKAIKIFN